MEVITIWKNVFEFPNWVRSLEVIFNVLTETWKNGEWLSHMTDQLFAFSCMDPNKLPAHIYVWFLHFLKHGRDSWFCLCCLLQPWIMKSLLTKRYTTCFNHKKCTSFTCSFFSFWFTWHFDGNVESEWTLWCHIGLAGPIWMWVYGDLVVVDGVFMDKLTWWRFHML